MIKENTKTEAYDCFGNPLLLGDIVSCVFLKYAGNSGWGSKPRLITVRSEVIGWSNKLVHLKPLEIMNNTDIPENLQDLLGIEEGTILKTKPDRICKLGQY